ncbi:MAG: hypothetical protein ACE5JD_12675 [Candidatus Methylomirabilia bacterium]
MSRPRPDRARASRIEPPRPLEEIESGIKAMEKKTVEMLREVAGS